MFNEPVAQRETYTCMPGHSQASQTTLLLILNPKIIKQRLVIVLRCQASVKSLYLSASFLAISFTNVSFLADIGKK